MSAAQVYFIRHGQTAWSITGQYTGRTDLPLTAYGEDEARRLAPLLADLEFSRVLVSPRQRARQTCKLAGLEAPSEVEPDLAEWDFGDYEGKFAVDMLKTRPGWNVWRDGSPGGETPAAVGERIDRLIARLGTLHGRVALFSHGQLGNTLAARWIGRPVFDGRHFVLDTASLSILGHHPADPELRIIERWNDKPENT